MIELLTLETESAIVEVLPAYGGSLAAFDMKVRGERLPVLRRWDGVATNPRSFASVPLTPWFNRLSGGGFSFGGKFHPIAANDAEDAFPLHGDGWQSAWEASGHAPDALTLRLRSRAIPPFDYEATQHLSLAGSMLTIELSLQHLGPEPLPYGLGQHPWFPRTPKAMLYAPAAGAWLEQPPDFPAANEPAPIPEKWDFGTPRELPAGFLDNGFAGWRGHARIVWPETRLALDIGADPGTRYYHVYSLGADCPFFCFEPVTHPNNAFGKPGTPAQNGLRVLAPGEQTSMRASFSGQRL